MENLTTAEQALKSVVEDTLGLLFISATIQEGNLQLDAVKDDQWPVVVYISPVKEKNRQNAPTTVNRTSEVFGFVLYKIKQDTTDEKTPTIKEVATSAKYIVDKLVKNLNGLQITDGDGIQEWETNETFSDFDALLHGVQFSFSWKIVDALKC